MNSSWEHNRKFGGFFFFLFSIGIMYKIENDSPDVSVIAFY